MKRMKKIVSLLLAFSFILGLYVSQGQVAGFPDLVLSAENGDDVIHKSIDDRIYTKNGHLFVPGASTVYYQTRQTFTGDYSVEIRAAVHYQALGLMIDNGQFQYPPLWSLALVNPFGVWVHPANNWGGVVKAYSPYVNKGEFCTMRLDVQGDYVKTYINNDANPINTIYMPKSYTNGALKFRFDVNESAEVDYLRVTQNGKVIWEDNFDFLDNTKWNFPQDLTNLMDPVWDGDTVFEEPTWPIRNQDGTLDDIALAYKADEILTVQNMQHTAIYKEGTDYALVDGKIRILPGSAIKVTPFDVYYPASGIFQARNGRFLYFTNEDAQIINSQLLVTYKHSDEWSFAKPEVKSSLLPKTTKILQNRRNLNIVYFGDSITEGFNSSGFMGTAPFMPKWSTLVTKALQQAYPNSKITDVNTAYRGTETPWGINEFQNRVNAYNPDLVVLAFGMNDGGTWRSADEFVNNLKTMIQLGRAKNPNCEFVVVTTSLPNPQFVGSNGVQELYQPAILSKLEAEGVAVADITQIHKDLLKTKKYADMTGNNINHPNDFLIRVYAQVVFETINGFGNFDDTVFNDVPYVDGSIDRFQTMDIKLPSTGEGPYPVIMFIHGGAWVIGDKTDQELRAGQEAALANGYAIANINYRYAKDANWPAPMYDCKAAARFLRANADKYCLDGENVIAWGASAGAHLAQFMGVTNGMPEFEDLAMGNAEYSSDVTAVLSYYGISNAATWYDGGLLGLGNIGGRTPKQALLGDSYTEAQALAASPITYVDENTVPMFLAHGKNDSLVWFDQSTNMEKKLKEYIDFELVDTYYPDNAEHAAPVWQTDPAPTKAAMNFLQKRLKPTVNLDSIENTRPSSWTVDISSYSDKYVNLYYANTTNDLQKLHLIMPPNKAELDKVSVLIFIHGGGFAGGESNGMNILYTAEGPLRALEKGYAVALVDYRLSQRSQGARGAFFPEPIYDIKAAIRYLRANASLYGLDTDRFAIWGESAGGHLVNFVGLTNNDPKYDNLSMGNAGYSSAVQAVVSFYAITDMTTDANAQYRYDILGSNYTNTEMIKEASPISHVTASAPPTYLQHGMADTEVHYTDSERLYDLIMEKTGGNGSKLELFPGITHAVRKFTTAQNVGKILTWLDNTLEPAPSLTGELAVSNIGTNSATISWETAANPTSLKEYAVYLNGTVIGKTTDTSYILADLDHNTTYSVSVRAVSKLGTESAPITASFTTDKKGDMVSSRYPNMPYLDGVTDHGIVLGPSQTGEEYYQYDARGTREAIINKVGDTYYMFYDGAGANAPYLWRACLATSKDLVNWIKVGPMLTPSIETNPGSNSNTYKDLMGACSPWVYEDNGKWHMFYLGNDTVAPDGTPGFAYNTLHASADSITGPWIKSNSLPGYSNFVAFKTKPGSYYLETASPGHVIQNPRWTEDEYNTESKFMMFFSASTIVPGVGTARTLGITRSDDLAAGDKFDATTEENFWQTDSQPILPLSEDIENSSIYYEPSNGYYFLFTNHVYANAYTDSVWVYWSRDPEVWNEKNKALVIDSNVSTWAKGAIGMPTVVKMDDNTLALVYDGVEGSGTGHLGRKIGLATISLPLTPPDLLGKLDYKLVDDFSSEVTFSEGWSTQNNYPYVFNNTRHYTNQANAYAEFTFTGSAIKWYGEIATNRGYADVYVDGEFKTRVDTFHPTIIGYQEGSKIVQYFDDALEYGQHTIKIVCVGTQNPSSLGAYITVDAFEVGTPNSLDIIAPTMPKNITASNITANSASISWDASFDEVDVSGYNIYLNGKFVANTQTESYTFANLNASTTYYTKIEAVDSSGNKSVPTSYSFATEKGPINLEASMIEAFGNVTVELGTAFDDIALPQVVKVQLSEDECVELEVVWDSSSYNPSVAGMKAIKGELVLIDGLTNTNNVMAEININVISTEEGFYIAKPEVVTATANKVEVKSSFKNNTTADKSLYVVIAMYDAKGKLVGSKKELVTIKAGQANAIELSCEALEPGVTAKVMYWNQNYTPIKPAGVISLNNQAN